MDTIFLICIAKVSSGNLSEAQIIAELERLVSNKWKWDVVRTSPIHVEIDLLVFGVE